jgi:hypothetical protein
MIGKGLSVFTDIGMFASSSCCSSSSSGGADGEPICATQEPTQTQDRPRGKRDPKRTRMGRSWVFSEKRSSFFFLSCLLVALSCIFAPHFWNRKGNGSPNPLADRTGD